LKGRAARMNFEARFGFQLDIGAVAHGWSHAIAV
jgi:hypothetical protein